MSTHSSKQTTSSCGRLLHQPVKLGQDTPSPARKTAGQRAKPASLSDRSNASKNAAAADSSVDDSNSDQRQQGSGLDQVPATVDRLLQRQKERFDKMFADQAQQLHKDFECLAQELRDQVDQHSQTDTPETRTWPNLGTPSGQHETALVRKLATCEMQKQDDADKEAREKKALNAILQNVEPSAEETTEQLEVTVNALFADTLQTSVVCAGAKRIKRKDSAPGHVLVQFASKEDKTKVFKARGKLKGSPICMDDDLSFSSRGKTQHGLHLRRPEPRASGHSGEEKSCLSRMKSALLSTKCSTSRKKPNRESSLMFC